MENNQLQNEKEYYASYAQEKLRLYKQTLEFIKSGDVLENFVQLQDEVEHLKKEVASLRLEIEKLINSVQHVVEEKVEIKVLKDRTAELEEIEPLSYRKLSSLLNSIREIDREEQEDESLLKKQQFDLTNGNIEQLPSSMIIPNVHSLRNTRSSNKHSIKIRGKQRNISPIKTEKLDKKDEEERVGTSNQNDD